MARTNTQGKEYLVNTKNKAYFIIENDVSQMRLALLTCDNQVLRVKGCFFIDFRGFSTKFHQHLECPIQGVHHKQFLHT